MKPVLNIFKVSFLFCMSISFTSPIPAADKKQRTAKAVIKTNFYCDHCKECETCGQKFEANLYTTKGIKSYEINEKKMTITVFYNPQKVDVTTIRKAISALGFDADDVKADPVEYSKLDPCCRN